MTIGMTAIRFSAMRIPGGMVDAVIAKNDEERVYAARPIAVPHPNQPCTRRIRLDRFGGTLDFRVIALSVSEYRVLEWSPVSRCSWWSRCACDARTSAAEITKRASRFFLSLARWPASLSKGRLDEDGFARRARRARRANCWTNVLPDPSVQDAERLAPLDRCDDICPFLNALRPVTKYSRRARPINGEQRREGR